MTQVSLQALIEGAKSGKLVSFPTDTIPALAVKPEKSELIFQAKRRSQTKPLILMGDKADSLWPYIAGSPQELMLWQQTAAKYWPGALTLVLPASAKVPPGMNPLESQRQEGYPTIGVRVPNCDLARKILAQTGPLATTSANISGQPALTTVAEIEAQFSEVLTLLPKELETIISCSGLASTVAKWNQELGWEILRSGAVKLEF